MARQRHAEIAGAGIGGLTAATALTQRGWSMRVHERAPHLRDIGVGTTVWQNGLRVLESIGALDEVMSCGTKISQLEILDERQHAVRLHKYNDTNDRALVVLRVDLHRALVNAARKVGVEILTSSPAAAADPDGTLILENGDRFFADYQAIVDRPLVVWSNGSGLSSGVPKHRAFPPCYRQSAAGHPQLFAGRLRQSLDEDEGEEQRAT